MAASKQPKDSNPLSQPQKEITHFVIFGDSLSDGKNMGEKASFLGPLAKKLWLKITGLNNSPKERFTNGYTWADSLKSTLVSKFLNDEQLKKDPFGKFNLNNADISDDVISHPSGKHYSRDALKAEIRKVRRKKRVDAREEGHLFTTDKENTIGKPVTARDNADIADIALAHSHKPKAERTQLQKRIGILKGAALQGSSDDISDQLITDKRYQEYVQEYYSLDNGRVAQYNGQNFFRNYSQGGSTSYDYSWKAIFLSLFSPLQAIKLFFTRLMVSNVSKQVEQYLEDCEKEEISPEQMEKTLITVFSGANDLITVNSEPTEEAAELAAQSNIDNIEKLIKQGYSNFVLCNLPDLSLTPRYQRKSDDERNTAKRISNLYNQKLNDKLQFLKERYPGCSLELFDISSVFTKIYEDVDTKGENSEYHEYFDKKELRQPYLDYAKEHNIKVTPGGVAPGYKHMFWDDVHPTATMHALLMSEFYKSQQGLAKFRVTAPAELSEEHLCKIFNRKYHEKLKEYSLGSLSLYDELPIDYNVSQKALISILRYALDEQNEDCDCLREAMSDLGWWVNDKPNMSIPALADAMWVLNPGYAQKLEAQLDPHLAEPNSHKMMLGALGGEIVGQKPQPKRVHPQLDPVVEERLKKIIHTDSNLKHEPSTPPIINPLTI
ncbi:SGNH/GDSL hydrolase family protein [Fluoribacter dumoffii]|uniref:Secreted effector protein sseJ n=1 Tax=Fluoribacter dumoffii TaxID=463 RepID=A0A377G8C5_9GAMM|nr:SGNH/GDSL hydrolase family protein [Fluoribacter dumoffii]KTC89938.1 lipolytic enzyme, GDSL family [Fluoribacter dumoffii NY 23]STO21056.1 Secreted effector protein sseJ [Fluoribacter dumoffii]